MGAGFAAFTLLAMIGVGISVTSAHAASTGNITAVIVNSDLVEVIGNGFPTTGKDVTVVVTADKPYSLDAQTDADGRWAVITFLPANYSGEVKVQATGGGLNLFATAAADGTGAPMAPSASPVPVVPLTGETATDPAPTTVATIAPVAPAPSSTDSGTPATPPAATADPPAAGSAGAAVPIISLTPISK